MRIVIQRVKRASVSVEEKVVGSIQKGFLVLIGVGQGDDEATADKYMKKLLGLRIFEDENGKTNLSLADVGGELLVISQFTLYADCKKGNRPSFVKAGAPDMAEHLYEHFMERCREQKNCMNIWSRKHGNRFLLSKRECSGLRWKYHW